MPRRPYRLVAFAIAVVAGVAVSLVATQVFPYRSLNHDEAVYLQQAAMLLDGKLFLRPPVADAFRPWFFVADGARLYAKYAPVPAVMFAGGMLLGHPSIALGAIGATLVALAYGTVAETFDRRTGLLAAAFVAASPLFLIEAGTFLPYAPTAVWTWLFAFAYLRADRTERNRWAALAGGAIGIAFFSRPYTAVLFAVPFAAHALWISRRLDRATLERTAVVAAVGTAGVLLALAYNVAVTGSPFVFPYEAFAPSDGLGFGRRAMLGYERIYTPALAVRANARVLWAFATRWFAAGLLGIGLAAVGLGTLLADWERAIGARRVALVGLVPSVVVGNLYFWGNLNMLGSLSAPADGLLHFLGPYYHFDLLLPIAALAAHGALRLAHRGRRAAMTHLGDRAPRVATAGLAVGLLLLSSAAVAAAAPPIQANRAVSEQLGVAYRPIEDRDLPDAVVLLPTPYGDWLNHPFQVLRNDPDFDGDVVYALRTRPFAVADAYPKRSLYRYTYRGFWAPQAGPPVAARLQPIQVVSGGRIELHARLGVPAGADAVSIRLTGDDGSAYYAATDPSDPLSVDVIVENGTASLAGRLTPQGPRSVDIADRDDVVVEAFVDAGPGSTFSYLLELPVDRHAGETRALTPSVEVCTVPAQCRGEAAYVPNETRPGVFVDTALTAEGDST